jgi:tetratricopeptide (TPR) repeat protein
VTCATLAENAANAREAVACYLEVARGEDLAAEAALVEIARLRRDVLGDGAGALAALQESRTRFPSGLLRDEVDLSFVELLADLNRHNEAIEEIGRLLADGHGVERTAELRVMRGNIYREVLEDYGHAERDYAAAEEARAPAVGDATFFRGICLQALGRTAEARAAYERYLAAGAARFADEADRRLQRLGR